MLLSMKRTDFTDKTAISMVWIDNAFECYFLEDRVRAKGVKVPKETAIPYGTYEIVMDWSERFQRIMPHLMNVPMFTGIRIHSGNYAVDTEGCLLAGNQAGTDAVFNSRDTFTVLYNKLMRAAGLDPDRGRDREYWNQMEHLERGEKIAIVIWSAPPDYVPA